MLAIFTPQKDAALKMIKWREQGSKDNIFLMRMAISRWASAAGARVRMELL